MTAGVFSNKCVTAIEPGSYQYHNQNAHDHLTSQFTKEQLSKLFDPVSARIIFNIIDMVCVYDHPTNKGLPNQVEINKYIYVKSTNYVQNADLTYRISCHLEEKA